MQPAAIDVAVLLLFFNRPDSLQKVFEQVRLARPSRLFLYQDGPRDERDREGIEACRRVVEAIDWECDVHRLYQARNQGCDPSGFLSQQWAFSLADKCIVLEDDCVPSQSFFPFCKELLDRYADDERIGMIAGFNAEEHTPNVAEDYFFTTNFSIWGWASWRRVIETRDAHYTFLDDPQAVRQLEDLIRERKLRRDFLPMCRAHRAQGIPFFETTFQAALLLHSQLSIMPTHNLVSNLGVSDDSTHFAGSAAALPRAYRRIFTMGRHATGQPLRHPRYVIENVAHRKAVYRIHAWGHPWLKAARSLEELWLNLRHGDFTRIATALRNRLRILCGGRRFH